MLMVDASDRVGALMEILQAFASRNVNVRQIENRPMPGDGRQARFFLEVTGHFEDAGIQEAIAGLGSASASAKILGSYPAPSWVEEH